MIGKIRTFASRPDTGVLTMYPKNVADSIPAHVLLQIREEVDNA